MSSGSFVELPCRTIAFSSSSLLLILYLYLLFLGWIVWPLYILQSSVACVIPIDRSSYRMARSNFTFDVELLAEFFHISGRVPQLYIGAVVIIVSFSVFPRDTC